MPLLSYSASYKEGLGKLEYKNVRRQSKLTNEPQREKTGLQGI